MDRLAEVTEFRNRLVEYANLVLENRPYGSMPLSDVDPDVLVRLQQERTSLTQTYGGLYTVINHWGVGKMSTPASGILSHDIVQDAIHSSNSTRYADIAGMATQHLDTVIGRLRGEAQERWRPETLYRLTSVAFWMGRLLALIRWLVVTKGGRIVAIVAAVVLAIIGGIASGWAQSLFTRP